MKIIVKVWAAFSLMLLGFTPSAIAGPSAYEFLKPSKNYGMEISPNGRYVAFRYTQNTKFCKDRLGQMTSPNAKGCTDRTYGTVYAIKVYDLQQKKMVKSIDLPPNYYPGRIEFLNNERLLAAIGKRTTVGRRGYSIGGSRLMSAKFTGTITKENEYVSLFKGNDKVLDNNWHLNRLTNLLPNDPEHILMPAGTGKSLDLWKVNVNTGKAHQVAIGEKRTFFWYTNRKGEPILRYDCKRKSCRKINVFSKNKETGEWKLFKTFETRPDEKEEEYDFWPIAPTDTENQFYVMSNEETDERASIKIYDLETEEYVRTVFEHAELWPGL